MGRVEDILEFWFDPMRDPRAWFVADPAFDHACTIGFLADHERAAAGGLDDWRDAPRSALALVLLLDQFPRNMFRGDARAFATDGGALIVARHMVTRRFDRALTATQRTFVYLPFEHSENLNDQDESVRLFRQLAGEDLSRMGHLEYAEHHRAIIRCFGRFPHRNASLSRPSSSLEAEFLARGTLPRETTSG